MKTFALIGTLTCALAVTASAGAQALPTATAAGNFQVGGGYTIANPDYGQKDIKGITGFADFDFSPHVGVEATVHYVALVTPTDLAENTYLVGPRFLISRGRFNLYAKGLIGEGDLVIQEIQDNIGHPGGFYFAYAMGGGVDIRATNHIVIRAFDAELQKWPNYGNGLSPVVITFGAAYRFR